MSLINLDFVNDSYDHNGTNYGSFAAYLSGSGSTFARSSTGTYINSSGVLSTASTNVARFTYIGGEQHLLIEPSRTNLVPYSEGFTTGWTQINTGSSTTGQADPAGGTAAVIATDSDSAATANLRSSSYTMAAGDLSISAFVKKDAVPQATRAPQIQQRYGSNFSGSKIDTSTGEAQSNGSSEAIGSSWWRLYNTFNNPSSTTQYIALIPAASNGVNNSSVNSLQDSATFFGVQCEQGSRATSYIPTSGSSATRAADVLTLVIPAAVDALAFEFDDGSRQVVTGLTGVGTYVVPTTLNRYALKSIVSVDVQPALLTQGRDDTNGTSYVTASISVHAGKPVVVHAGTFANSDNAGVAPSSVTFSGGGLTLSLLDSHRYDTFQGRGCHSVWGGIPSGDATGTITITYAATQENQDWGVLEIDTAEASPFGTPAHALGGFSSSAVSISLASQSPPDITLAFFARRDGSGTSPPTATPRTGWTELYEQTGADGSTGHSLQGQYSPPGGDTTASVTWTRSGETGIIVVPVTITAAASGYTLTADPGSVAITGTAASLKAGRNVAASAGSVAITGAAATLRRGLLLSAAGGALTVTGTAAALTATRLLTAEAGAVVVTGTDAALKAARNLDANVGSVAITGTAATLTYGSLTNYTLTAEAGAVAITGIAAALTATRVLAADTGAVEITSTDATLSKVGSYTLTADPGSVTLSGASAALTTGRRLVAAVGSVAIAGTSARLARLLSLTADQGAILITGTAAGLAATRLLTADPWSVTITGQDAALTFRQAGGPRRATGPRGQRPPALSGTPRAAAVSTVRRALKDGGGFVRRARP